MNVAALSTDAKSMYGDENFNMLTSGISSKTGYKIECQGGDYILQPNLQFRTAISTPKTITMRQESASNPMICMPSKLSLD